MVFRLPSNFESFIPPPSDQRSQLQPWRGSIIVAGMRASDRNSSQEIRLTAVETDGDNRTQQWPAQFYAQITYEPPLLRNVQSWVRQNAPPLCTFMAERLRDPNANVVNLANFRTLSHVLNEHQAVVVAPWGTNAFTGGGIIIYPSNSTSMLVGALFLYMPFPEFVIGLSSPILPMSASAIHQSEQTRQSQYQQAMIASTSYASPSHHRHAQSLSPHRSNPSSPVEQPISGHGREQYRYLLPRNNQYNNQGQMLQASSEDPSTWPAVKAEDDSSYATFSPTHQNPPFQ